MLRRVAELADIAELDVLETTAVAEVAAHVHALEPHWRRRSVSSGFFTLGTNSYMDLAPPAAAHAAYEDGDNALLAERFSDCYDVLAARLGAALELDVQYPGELARPGFHIWVGQSIPQTSNTSVHFDLQYLPLVKRPRWADADGTVSFTLPVQLPANGAGLHVWPDVHHPATREQVAAARATPPTVVPYRIGTAVVHSGHVLHQIGTTRAPGDDEYRITLQGHGLVVGRELFLYW